MGGKTKQSQRTKNNVRPSSSGRSAELLNNSVKFDSLNTPLSPGKVLPTLFPTLASTNFDQGLNAEYSVCFKKITKKDPITKTKALQELSELIKNSNVDDTVAALPSWAHFYSMLTVDTDRRVREATQVCHGLVMRTCGRRAAPQLRRLLPAWLLAGGDDHAPARALAAQHLQNTFPDGKLEEALTFCKLEIMALLTENLTGNAEAMLSKKLDEAEERELSVCRVASASAHALALFVRMLPRAHDDWLWAALQPLLRAPAFWRSAAHADDRLRCAWYCAAGQLAARLGARLEQAGAGVKLARALLAQPERGAGAAAERWAALLLLARHTPEWHTWLDKKDLLVKRLLDFLENGGGGSARAAADCALPLLPLLPADMLTRDFYIKFFDAIFIGLNTKSILMSKSERQTWLNILSDCLLNLSSQPHDYVLEVVSLGHRTWLENVFAVSDAPQRTNLLKHSAHNMTSLLKHWLKQFREGNERADQLVRNFWQNVGSTLLSHIDKLAAETHLILQLVEDHILFLKAMQESFAQVTKKRSIKFEDDAADDPADAQDWDSTSLERFKHNLRDLVSKVCCQYFNFAKQKEMSQAVFTPLTTLLIQFDDEALFVNLARHFSADTVYGLYDRVLRVWLSGDTMRCKPLVDIVFLAAKYLSEAEQDRMFHSFQQFPPSVVEWCMARVLSEQHLSPAQRRWMRGEVVGAAAAGLCRRVDGRARDLLVQSLAARGGEVIVSEATVKRVVQACGAILAAGACRGDIVARVCGALAGGACAAECAPLLLARHAGRIRPRANDAGAVESPQERACWRAALCALDEGALAELASSALAGVREYLLDSMDSLDIKRIEHITSLCLDLVPDVKNEDDISGIVSFSKRLFSMQLGAPRAPLEVFALRCDVVGGALSCPLADTDVIKQVIEDSDKEADELTRSDLLLHVNKSVFRAHGLRALLLGAGGRPLCNVLLGDEYFREELMQTVYEYTLLDRLCERYAFWPHYEIIQQSKENMEEVLTDILKVMSNEVRECLSTCFSERAATRGYYWAYASKVFALRIRGIDSKEVPFDENKLTDCHEANDPSGIDELETEHPAPEDEQSESECKDASPFPTSLFNVDKLEDIVTGSGLFHSLQADMKWTGSAADRRHARYAVMMRAVYCAHAHEPSLLARLLRDAAAAPGGPDPVINAYYQHNHVMLYDKDLTAAPWAQVVSNAAIVDYLSELVRERGLQLPAHHWDFVTITLCSLLTAVLRTQRLACLKASIIARAVLPLAVRVRATIARVRAEAERRLLDAHVLALPLEWADIFAPDLQASAVRLTLHLLQNATNSMTATRVAIIGELIPFLHGMEWDKIPAPLRHGELALDKMAAAASGALQGVTHFAYKYLAYYTLRLLALPLVDEDGGKLAAWSESTEDSAPPVLSPAQYAAPLLQLQELLQTALSGVREGEETCEMVPHSDSHGLALGYLLLANAVHHHCALAAGDLAQHYVELGRQHDMSGAALSLALRLLPAEVAAYALDAGGPEGAPAHLFRAFRATPPLDVHEACGRVVGALACRLVLRALQGAAGGVAGAAAGAGGALLRRLVPAAVAPALVARQLRILRERAHELPDAQVSVKATGEVTCAVVVEERTLELTLRFASDHPLGPPVLSSPPPAPDTAWLARYLAHQNGALVTALKMWARAVTARVASAPQCYICYCRMHPRSGRLPSVPCRQCRHTFHSTCLRKWFSTSGKSICPLCRSNF